MPKHLLKLQGSGLSDEFQEKKLQISRLKTVPDRLKKAPEQAPAFSTIVCMHCV